MNNERKPIIHGVLPYQLPTVIGWENGMPVFDPVTTQRIKEGVEQDKIHLEANNARILKIIELASQATEVSRDFFGEGNAGNLAYEVVKSGEPCALYIDDQKTRCGKKPIGTVDIDNAGNLELYTFCSLEHYERLKEDLYSEIFSKGGRTTPGTNGLGRN
jgi:hypothetical protein